MVVTGASQKHEPLGPGRRTRWQRIDDPVQIPLFVEPVRADVAAVGDTVQVDDRGSRVSDGATVPSAKRDTIAYELAIRAALWCFSGGSFQEFNLLNIGRGFSLIPRGGGVNSKTDSRDHGNFIFSKICLKGGDEVEF